MSHVSVSCSARTATILLVMALATFTAHAEAATVSVTDSLPAENVIASNDVSTDQNRTWRNNLDPGRRDLGQTFAVTDSTQLDAITVQLRNDAAGIGAGALGASFEIQIHTFDDASDQSPAAPVASESGVLPATMNPGDYLAFDFDAPVALTGGTQYSFVLHFPEQAEARQLDLGIATNDPYPAGRTTETTGDGTWGSIYNDSTWDYVFAAQAVPEPASLALLGLGGLAMVSRRRR